MDGLSLDQLLVFVTVVDQGSFSAAARRLHRAQSAVTYAVHKLEAQAGAVLFDRSAYRPALSDAGRALLPRARRILEEVGEFRAQARGIAGGLEPELAMVIDAMFPMPRLVCAMADFQSRFPSVHTRLFVESLGATAQSLLRGQADIGVVTEFASDTDELVRAPAGEIELVAVAAPRHPLAQAPRPIPADLLRDQVQLVLTDRSALTSGRDQGVVATRSWRLADLGAKHAMLRAGLGWGSMPRHMVEADLMTGALVRLFPGAWDGSEQMPRLAMVTARRKDHVLGPAGRWMLQRLASDREVAELSQRR